MYTLDECLFFFGFIFLFFKLENFWLASTQREMSQCKRNERRKKRKRKKNKCPKSRVQQASKQERANQDLDYRSVIPVELVNWVRNTF